MRRSTSLIIVNELCQFCPKVWRHRYWAPIVPLILASSISHRFDWWRAFPIGTGAGLTVNGDGTKNYFNILITSAVDQATDLLNARKTRPLETIMSLKLKINSWISRRKQMHLRHRTSTVICTMKCLWPFHATDRTVWLSSFLVVSRTRKSPSCLSSRTTSSRGRTPWNHSSS